ncbi:MAG TPA: endonuclease/exonuclease/phosphatase family protein [Bryobacteraceae bacterium]|nr:endonuclease/exonuclease/phosphatase family protein [Bryobacteraceae bacterium]
MRFAALLLLCLPALPSSSTADILSGTYAPVQTRADNAIRILDWNIDRGARFEQVLQSIERFRPDLCLLQEVDVNAARSGRVNVADQLARALRLNYVFGQAFEELGQGNPEAPAIQGQATLSAWPLLNTRIIHYNRQTGFWAPRPWLPNRVPLLQRRAGGRIGLVSEINVGGRTMVVYNLHLESRGPGRARWLQLRETIADARRYSADTPILLAGDLNTKYAASRFTGLLERNGFHDCLDGHSGKTHRIIGRLDWIFVRGPLACSSAEVDHEARGSDHFPLTAVLRMKP